MDWGGWGGGGGCLNFSFFGKEGIFEPGGAVRKNKKDGIYVYSKCNIWGLPNFGVIVDLTIKT